MEKGCFAERFESCWTAFKVGSGAEVFSHNHTWFLAVLTRASFSEFVSVKQQTVCYMKSILQGHYTISLEQLFEFTCLLCDHNRWRAYPTDTEASRVFQCFIIHSLLQCRREDKVLLHRIGKFLEDSSNSQVELIYTERARIACVNFYGAAWWDVAFDLFEGIAKITPQLYEIMVAQPNAVASIGKPHCTLPQSLA